ncbi:GEVED domain-containing protein [Chryseobacterium chendengshani]|uniref:GEVED domain-containing protein n=1 Tax=Chryseobacterium sp. LJ756 TaxID=2864113 RepID=UPI001C642730|nr:GEVED domain-containing protein [Chryseobacterium sp. LJ756]MBW7674994.1 T9SS type A sorting domain-containing protein [Chryseobacterium sp. LJ756]
MKKVLLTGFLAFGLITSAQTYCVPEFSSGCNDGDQIDSFEIPNANFSHLDTGCSTGAYGDFTAQTISMNAGVNYPFSITHDYGSQNVAIWIDFNNDGTFEASTELVATGSSVSGSNIATNSSIAIPATAPVGLHRMRVADRYNTAPIPCNIDGYGEAHDYTVNIGAAPSCLAPNGLSVTAVSSTSATLSWVAPTSTVGVGYEYYLSTSSASPSSTTAATASVASPTITATLSGLSSITTYYVWVRSVCTTTTKSDWSSAASFTTLCGVVVPNFTFDFASGVNVCWSNADTGTPATGPSGTYSNWYEDGFLNNGYTGAMKVNLYTSSFFPTTFDSWLITPVFDLSAGGYRVKFDYGLTQYGDTTAGTMGSDDVVQFVVSQDGGTTWTVLQTWNEASAVSNTSTQYSLDLTSYMGANTKFAFYATNGSVADTNDVDFFIDNLIVEPISLATSEVSNVRNNIKAYPNPFSDVLNISDVANVKSVSVVDIAGRLVKSIDKPTSALHLEELKSGLYMVILNMNDGSKQTIKAIKK